MLVKFEQNWLARTRQNFELFDRNNNDNNNNTTTTIKQNKKQKQKQKQNKTKPGFLTSLNKDLPVAKRNIQC